MRSNSATIFLMFLTAFSVACGGGSPGGAVDGAVDGDGTPIGGDGGLLLDDGGTPPDGAIGPANCEAALTECSDCVDNDSDGRIDGFDPECTSAADDLEDSFATGIPGDNIDPLTQDCFFDGNSGEGDDGCSIATCCLLTPDDPSCPPPGPGSCTPSQMCIDTCLPATTPGCDCFGCCTICEGPDCHTVQTNPQVAPDCTYDVISDETKCPTCTQVEECSNPCDPEQCILCPGQTEDDLPASCSGEQLCADGSETCGSTADCPNANQFCSQGCCVVQID